MKTVKEIKAITDMSHLRPSSITTRMIAYALIGITEHLEAGTAIHGVLVQSNDEIEGKARREGMITALRWGIDRNEYEIAAAVTRLTNGGDL